MLSRCWGVLDLKGWTCIFYMKQPLHLGHYQWRQCWNLKISKRSVWSRNVFAESLPYVHMLRIWARTVFETLVNKFPKTKTIARRHQETLLIRIFWSSWNEQENSEVKFLSFLYLINFFNVWGKFVIILGSYEKRSHWNIWGHFSIVQLTR